MNKQIEEMANIVHDADAKIICDMLKAKPDDFVGRALPRQVYIAKAIYNAGYRKASQEGAECPTCHGTGMVGTTDWLTRGIDKEKLAKEREEALAEYEAQKKRDVAREIFEEIDRRLSVDENGFNAIAEEGLSEGHAYCETYVHNLRAHLAELKKKYESEERG